MRLRRLFLIFILSVSLCAVQVQGLDVPELKVKVPGRSALNPIPAETVAISVRIAGFLAETSLTFSFRNPGSQLLEGEFAFPLPEGSTVSGYALDVDERMVEGVIVEKERAKAIFEREVRRAIDPGLVEHEGGTRFRTRVYPLPANGTRTLMIRYLSSLQAPEGLQSQEVLFTLPVRSSKELPSFRMDVRVLGGGPPRNLSSPLFAARLKQTTGTYSLSVEKRATRLEEELRLAFPVSDRPSVWVEQNNKGEWYFMIQHLPRSAPYIPEKPVETVSVLWDASSSHIEGDPARERELLAGLIRLVKPKQVSFRLFHSQAEAPRVFAVTDGQSVALLDTIEAVAYDGGTNMGAAAPAGGERESEADLCLLFSDGNTTFGREVLPELRTRTHTFSSSTNANGLLLSRLASMTGGSYFDLGRQRDSDVLAAIRYAPFSFISARSTGGGISDLLPGTPEPVSGPFILAGRLTAASAAVSLTYGYGTQGTATETVLVERSAPQARGLVYPYWALRRLNDLLVLPEGNRNQILRTSRQSGLVTPYTSLLVLERLDQYVNYRVEPPASWPEFNSEYWRRVAQQTQDSEAWARRRTNELADDYRQLAWWWENASRPGEIEEPAGTHKGSLSLPIASKRRYVRRSGGCFPAGTGVLSAGGPRPIETVDPGTEVYAFDLTAGKWVLGKVVRRLSQRYQGDMISIRMGQITIRATGNHPFYVLSGDRLASRPVPQDVPAEERNRSGPGRWVEARALKEGDLLQDKSGAGSVITGLASRQEKTEVYNLEVEALHNYAVQRRGILVHNKGSAEKAVKEESPPSPEVQAVPQAFAIDVEPWDPLTPYLRKLDSAGEQRAYQVYLDQRWYFGRSPAYYLDCAEWFFRHGSPALGQRVLSNILEFGWENPELLTVVAKRLERYGQLDSSAWLFERVLSLRPEDPAAWRDLALIEARRDNHDRALELLAAVAQGSWAYDWFSPEDADTDVSYGGIAMTALIEYNRLRELAAREGVRVRDYITDERLLKRFVFDIRVVLSWETPDIDIALLVTEPSGENAYYRNMHTQAGGMAAPLFMRGYGPEEYLLSRASPGTYRIQCIYLGSAWGDELGPITVSATVFTDYGRPNEKMSELTVRLTKEQQIAHLGDVVWR